MNELHPYDEAAVSELADHARRLGVQFKINGYPFGAEYDHALWEDFHNGQGGLSSLSRGLPQDHEKIRSGGDVAGQTEAV
jgi:hypothetical protein